MKGGAIMKYALDDGNGIVISFSSGEEETIVDWITTTELDLFETCIY